MTGNRIQLLHIHILLRSESALQLKRVKYGLHKGILMMFRLMKTNLHSRIMLCCLVLLLFSACGNPEPVVLPTVTDLPTQTLSTATPVSPSPSPTVTDTPTAAPSPTDIPTQTDIPFSGFLEYFRLYRTWYDSGNTIFYFLNAGQSRTLYALANEYELVCDPDPSDTKQMICVYANGEIQNETKMEFKFFTDETRQNLVYIENYDADLINDVVYHNQFSCPDRGKNVTCVSEYRLYDGVCYYAHTCYDACGLYYSKDNLPDVWNEFQGYTTPCD